jgi:hypothetical protein
MLLMSRHDNSMTRHRRWRAFVAISATAMVIGTLVPAAISFGESKSTLAKAIGDLDVAVIARLVARPASGRNAALQGDPPIAAFEIVEVLKGTKLVAAGKQINVAYFDDKPVGTEYLIGGVKPPAIEWIRGSVLSPRSHKYLVELMKLPADEPKRLVYFMSYLGDKEELLADDSRDEFSFASTSALKAISEKMPHDELVKCIQNLDTFPSHRRVYLRMIGICGTARDVPTIERLLRSDEPRFKTSLDAVVACYLWLRGEDGLPFVEKLFLEKNSDLNDMQSIVVALRVLGNEKKGPIPVGRIARSMRRVLGHPRLADQVIVDLARWQDWSVMDRVVELFTSTDKDVTAWVRVPAITYLRMCPLPKAKEYLTKLKKIDPVAARQSEAIYPLSSMQHAD